MTAAIDVFLGLVLLGTAVFLLLGVGRDVVRSARARRALVMRRLEDIGLLIPANAPEMTNAERVLRWKAKRAAKWPVKVAL